jgi:integrase
MKIRDRTEEVLESKRLSGKRPSTMKRLRILTSFVDALEKVGVLDSDQITHRHVLDLQKSFLSLAETTRIIRTRDLRLFLGKLKRHDLAEEVSTPRETAEGRKSRAPKPYTDAEIAAFRAVAEPIMELFFLTSIQTGLAVCDLVRLRVEDLRDGCIVIHRLKTGKQCIVPIPADLFQQLRIGLPFYRGQGPDSSATQILSERVRVLQQKAGIYRKGSLVHRGRDSFVERQLAAGVPLAVIAARLGDLVSTMERHYADLLSPKMRDLNLAQPTVSI